MSVVRHYELHGEIIEVEAVSVAWANAVQEILGAYRRRAVATPTLRARLRDGGNELHVPRELEERGRFGDLVFHVHPPSGVIWIEVHGRGWVEVDLSASRIEAALSYDPREDEWFVAHHAFYPALLEILKTRGLFPTHAGLLAHGQDGLLISGASGSGKTTLCLALATHGWGFLADDTCFLRYGESGIRGLAFWEDLHVTEETLRRFDSLDFLRQQIPRRENWKRHFAVDQLEGLHTVEHCLPRWLLFPRIRPGEASELRAVSPADALRRLMPQSVIPVSRRHTELQLALLARLVEQVSAREFAMGEDLDEAREVLEEGLMGRSRG